jgi:protein TonB
MRRFLAISLALHLLFLVALVLSGSLGARDPRYPPVYQINLVAAPRAEVLRRPRERPRREEPEPEVEREEPETAPEPEPEILEPEEELVPEETVESLKPEEPEPAREGPESEPTPEEPPPENPTPDAGGNDAAIDLTIEGKPFPFPGYLDRMVNKIGRNWRKAPNRQPLRALVYFRVERSGRVGGIEVRESSGDFLFDQAAMRAVADASPLPPLPDGYTSDFLGVYFDFNEEKR